MPEPSYSAVFRNAKPLARAIHEATGCVRVGTAITGWDVPHFHCHRIPRFGYHDLDPSRAKEWSLQENADIQRKIVSRLG